MVFVVDAMFEAMSDCQALHPDDEDSFSDADDGKNATKDKQVPYAIWIESITLSVLFDRNVTSYTGIFRVHSGKQHYCMLGGNSRKQRPSAGCWQIIPSTTGEESSL